MADGAIAPDDEGRVGVGVENGAVLDVAPIAHHDRRVVGPDHGAFNQVLEFPNISGPIVCRKCVHCWLRYLLDPLSHAPGELLYKVQHQVAYVILAFSQRRYRNWEYV